MLLKTKTVANRNMETRQVIVEVNITNKGFPSFEIIGMAGKSVQESKERIRSAINSCGFEFPRKKVLVNLFPADIPKFGSSYDLPIATCILAFLLDKKIPDHLYFYGELSLDGGLVYCKGGFNLGLYLLDSFNVSNAIAVVSKKNSHELSGLSKLKYFSIDHLLNLVPLIKSQFSDTKNLRVGDASNIFSNQKPGITAKLNIEDIKGHERVKRALLISIAGNHNMLMLGSPGNGKSMLGKSIESFLPPLMYEECLEVTKIYSYAGLLTEEAVMLTRPPFRSPHHSCSEVSLLGGGNFFRPGEVSLSHKGVLFLDEFLEFSENKLNLLRQPMSDGYINVSRNNYSFKVLADFLLIATANPCPCGFYGSEKGICRCTDYSRSRYLNKMSGPMKDRFDMFVPVDIPVECPNTVTSREYLEILIKFKNANINNSLPIKLSSDCTNILKTASSKYNLSMRSQDAILRVSKTIGILDMLQKGGNLSNLVISPEYLYEALSYKTPFANL